MEIKTGIDIMKVERIKSAIERQKEKFLEKVYTENEIEFCNNTGKMKYQHYAARFAAKEAIYKAISDKIPVQTGDIWTKIEICNNPSGKPFANIEKLNLQNIESMDLSLSHIAEYAIASFTILFKE